MRLRRCFLSNLIVISFFLLCFVRVPLFIRHEPDSDKYVIGPSLDRIYDLVTENARKRCGRRTYTCLMVKDDISEVHHCTGL